VIPSVHTKDVLQLVFNSGNQGSEQRERSKPATLADLRHGEGGVLERLEVPENVARRLMELGFLPGSTIIAARSAPSGDPLVFRVDGTEVALRKETAARLRLRQDQAGTHSTP